MCKFNSWFATILTGAVAWGCHHAVHAAPPAEPPLEVGDRLQLFLDDYLIDSIDGAKLKLHHPRPAELVIEKDKPWEDETMYDSVVIKDGDRYRIWYRTNFNARPFYTGYAESADGVRWTKPNLGLIEFQGSKDNNLVWTSGPDGAMGCVLSIFKDGNPNTPASRRYKGFATRINSKAGETGILGLVSPDGLRWQLLQPGLILRGAAFDSHNLAFWTLPAASTWPTSATSATAFAISAGPPRPISRPGRRSNLSTWVIRPWRICTRTPRWPTIAGPTSC